MVLVLILGFAIFSYPSYGPGSNDRKKLKKSEIKRYWRKS